MLSLLVGKTVKKNANGIDEDARKALERTLQGEKPDVEVKIKTYLVTPCGEAEKSSWRAKAMEHNTDHLTCEFWGRKECSNDLWHPAIEERARKEGQATTFNPQSIA
jgi:hypothetical protein